MNLISAALMAAFLIIIGAGTNSAIELVCGHLE